MLKKVRKKAHDIRVGIKKRKHGGQVDADWYDDAYCKAEDRYSKHYTSSIYWGSWNVIMDRIRRAGRTRVLEVGCGPAQLAAAMHDAALLEDYRGLDFSSKAIELAQANCPALDFVLGDARKSDIFETFDYDCVITTEFLEHVEQDLEVLGRIRPGVQVLATVPNFDSESHLRFFDDAGEVRTRYRAAFVDLDVTECLLNDRGLKLYLLDGVTRGG